MNITIVLVAIGCIFLGLFIGFILPKQKIKEKNQELEKEE